MATCQKPQPMLVKAEFARTRGQPGTDVVVEEEWLEKRISANHPSQAQGFGIVNMLTAVTSDGRVTTDEDSNNGSNTSGSTSKEPWTLVTGNKQGRQLKPVKDQEERESTDLPDNGGATRDKDIEKRKQYPAQHTIRSHLGSGEKKRQSQGPCELQRNTSARPRQLGRHMPNALEKPAPP